MAGNNFPRWEIISPAGESFSGGISCLPSLQTTIPEATSTQEGRPQVDIPVDGRLEGRQAVNPTVENDFTSWEMVPNRGEKVSHRRKSFPTVFTVSTVSHH